MNNIFSVNSKDSLIVIKLINEANIMLASINKSSIEYENKYNLLKESIDIMRNLHLKTNNKKDIEFIFNTLNTIYNKGILTPLTLKNEEFNDYMTNNKYINKRYPYIYRDSNGKIYNSAAYKLYIRSAYDNVINSQIKCTPYITHSCINNDFNIPIFISKGGIITGEYIQQCEIRKDIIDKHHFTIQSIITIPVSVINDKDNIIFIVDHREPKIKILKEFYEVPICINNDIKNKHYNLRKYIKINK